MDKILTVNDVANVLQVKAITVRQMFRESRLRGFKVGKAWRTTEPMLQEDIAALARGEAPAVVAKPAHTANGKRNGKTPAAPKAPRARKEAQKVEEAPAKYNNPVREDADDTQQLLF